jgi:RND family efflux transporter MFP subunit
MMAVCHGCLVLAAVASGCAGPPSSAAKAATAPEGREVRLAQVTEARLDRSIVVSGSLAAEESAVMSMRVPGRLAGLMVDLGSAVAAGQTIAFLEPTDFKLRVAQAEAALRQARARLGLRPEGPVGDDDRVNPDEVSVVRQARAVLDEATLTLARVKAFVQRGISSRSELDSAETAFKVAESRHQDAIEEVRNRQAILAQRRSELELAREQLAATVLKAPFGGLILERPAALGQYVDAGTSVAVLVRVDTLRLQVEVPEREATRVRVSQDVRVSVEGDETRHSGRIARLSPAISTDNRTLLVEAEIPNVLRRLRPGAFVRAEIVIDSAPALLIPSASVVTFAGVDKVFIVQDGKAVERRVQLGRRAGDRTEVLKGLETGDAVVTQPGTLVSGQAVRVTAG